MPNQFQIAFIATFVLTFTALVLTSRYLNSRLLQAGYDLSEIILIGLPATGDMSTPATSFEFNYTQLLAFVFALATSVFVYLRFGTGRKPVLNPKLSKEFPLIKKISISPNTAIYRFALPHPHDVLGLPVGQHISLSADINGKEITRSYTPTSSDDDRGHFDLLIKSYEKGNVSRHVGLLKIGDNIRVKGPKGQFRYHPTLARELGMIAGGTGITPMLQIIRATLKNPLDRTRLRLIYANVNPEDILLKKELDAMATKHSHRFKIFYVLNNPPPDWAGGVGFVSKSQIQEHMPAPDENIKILLCGPPPMVTAMKKHLDDLKYPAPRTVSKVVDQVFVF